MTNRNFVILGASGFIAQALTSFLARKGCSVICFSRKPILNAYENVTYQKIDNYENIVFPKNAIVYHLAETHHIKNVEEQGLQYISQMENLASSLLNKPFFRFIYASSTVVYGDLSLSPNNPDFPVPLGKTIYALAKQSVEEIILKNGGIVARLTNIYGLGMSKLNIFADILNQLNNNSITLREATPIRDYLYIDDLVKCFYNMGIGEAKGIFNLASGEAVSCEELCQLILTTANRIETKINFLSPPRNSIIRLDISKTEEKFAWHAEYSLKEGIKKLLENFHEK